MRRKPIPRVSPVDAAYGLPTGSIRLRDLIVTLGCGVQKITDDENFLFGQNVHWSVSSPVGSAVTDSIRLVHSGGIPLQVLQTIVRPVSIEMPTLHTFWTGANEGFEDETVDEHIGVLIAPTQDHFPVPIIFSSPASLWSKLSGAVGSLSPPHPLPTVNVSVFRGSVPLFVSGNPSDTTSKSGFEGFKFIAHDSSFGLCDQLRRDPTRYSDFCQEAL